MYTKINKFSCKFIYLARDGPAPANGEKKKPKQETVIVQLLDVKNPAAFDEKSMDEASEKFVESRREKLAALRKEMPDLNVSMPRVTSFDEDNFQTPQGVQEELVKVNAQSAFLQKEGIDLASKITDFQKALQAFEAEKKDWGVFLRGSPLTDDEETEQLKQRLWSVRNAALQKLIELKNRQRSIAEYGKKVTLAVIVLREKKEKERIEKQNGLTARDTEIDSKKKKNETQYRAMKNHQKNLSAKRDEIVHYRDSLDAQLGEIAAGRRNQAVTAGELSVFDNHLDDALEQINDALQKLPKDSLQYRQLKNKKEDLMKHKNAVQTGLVELGTARSEEEGAKLALSRKKEEVEPGITNIDQYLEKTLNPSLNALNTSIRSLEIAKLKNGTEHERIEAEYGEMFDTLEVVNHTAADIVLETSQQNSKLIEGLDMYVHSLDNVEIEGPGLWDATAGLFFGKAKDGLCGMIIDPASAWIKDVTKDIPVVNVLTEIVANLVLDLPSGMIEGAGELVSGISTMLAHPVNAVVGLGALIGRDPRTGEWSAENAGTAYKAIGLALISYDHFEKGEVGKGIGKVAFNVLLTATGVGAAAKGAQAAEIAYAVAKTAGSSTLRASGKAAITGASVFSRELVGGLVKLPGETLSTLGKAVRAPAALAGKIKDFASLSAVGRLDLKIAGVDKELATLQGQVENFTIGGRKVFGAADSFTAKEISELPAIALRKLGITEAKTIQELLRLKDLIAKQERLYAAKYAAEERLAEAAYKNELREKLTKGLRPEERELFNSAYLDRMTGMLNRGGLNYLKRMIADNRRVSIASFDADHFKALNSAGGTKFGDSIIQTIGNHFDEVAHELRAQGFEVYGVRMGGEEFVLFGDVPKEVMAKALEKMAARLKATIRRRLSPEQMTKMAKEVYREKYVEQAGGLKKAYREVGGSTVGVGEVQFAGEVDYGLMARQSLQMVDSLVEKGKGLTGRGKVYEYTGDAREATAAVRNLIEDNHLTKLQNMRMEDLAFELQRDVNALAVSRTPLRQNILARCKTNFQMTLANDFFETPPFNMGKTEKLAEATGVTVGELRQAKIECIHDALEYGTYSGASTMRKLESLGGEFSEARRIEVGEFKSINETMGHTHGDTFLTWIYQEVISRTAETSFAKDQIVIAQKGANFYYRLRIPNATSLAKVQKLFEKAVQKNYERQLKELFVRINEDSILRYEDTRATWIRRNKAASAETATQQMYSLSFN